MEDKIKQQEDTEVYRYVPTDYDIRLNALDRAISMGYRDADAAVVASKILEGYLRGETE